MKEGPLYAGIYAKGNTRQYFRRKLPPNSPAKLAYLLGLPASKEICHSAKHRPLIQIVFAEDVLKRQE